MPTAPHTLTWDPWEECDSDGVSDAESGSELAAAGFQEQTHGPRQAQYLGLGLPEPGWREDWTAAFHPSSLPRPVVVSGATLW